MILQMLNKLQRHILLEDRGPPIICADSSILGFSEDMGSGAATVGTATSTNLYYYNASNNEVGNSRTDESAQGASLTKH